MKDEQIDKATGILKIEFWGNGSLTSHVARGFVRDVRFAGASGDQVIKGTNRTMTKKWRKAVEEQEKLRYPGNR